MHSISGPYNGALIPIVKKKNDIQGFAIGNGLTNPAIQHPEYPDFALDNKIITKAQHDDIIKSIPGCEEATKNCESKGGQSCETALNVCQGIFDSILSIAGDINYYDIRKKCVGQLCYDFNNVEKLLNLHKVKRALLEKGINVLDPTFWYPEPNRAWDRETRVKSVRFQFAIWETRV
ncbi:serine carboxypeptidase-like 49 [Glycine soja]|uniref:serine carboxypeptidase-like 49 n=1 Tax=Glycine soja TaxID=3848 RepID=UPI00103BB098|nr:serine carboxypeptidase-like 49 [Glycine soja]